MPIRAAIPASLELAQDREMRYRARCAWGGNHLRRTDKAGNVMARVGARSASGSHPVAVAVDGYRPHEDPLNAAYAGYWESTGRPLIARQYANQLTSGYTDQFFGDDFTGADGTLLAAHTPNINNSFDVWHDPNTRWQIIGNALVRYGGGQGDASAYIDHGLGEYDLAFNLYVDNTGAYDAGVNICFKDYANLLYVRLLSNDNGRVDIIEVRNGSNYGAVAYSTAWTITTGWHPMYIVVRNDNIKVFVDGVKYIDWDWTGQRLFTRIGPDCWPGCAPKWDSLKIYRPLRFYEAFADWSNWSIATYGSVTGNASAISGKWGKLSAKSSAGGTEGGITASLALGRLTAAPVLRDSLFQLQLGGRKYMPAGSDWSESGITISDTAGADVSAEQNGIQIAIRNTSSGSNLIMRKMVAGVATTIATQALGNYSSENIRIHFQYLREYGQKYVQVRTAKYGLFFDNFCAWMPETVYVKTYTRGTDAGTLMEGFFRDFGIFPGRKILVGGEVGFFDDFNTFNERAWHLSSRFGQATLMEQVTLDGESALYFHSAGGEWCYGVQVNDAPYEDWVYEGKFKQGNRTNIYFCVQDADSQYARGYAVQFEQGITRFVKNTSDSGASWETTIKELVDLTTAGNEVFTVKIVKQGTRFKVYKNNVMIFDLTDASYNTGLFGFQSFADGFHCYWHKVSPRGLQQPVQLRIDRPMIQNASFEEWDDLDGLTYDAGVLPNSWRVALSSSGTMSRQAGVEDGGYAVRIAVANAQADAYMQHDFYQQGVRFIGGHRYRVSFRAKLTNTGGGLIGGHPYLYALAFKNGLETMKRWSLKIAEPTQNLLAADVWHLCEFDFVAAYDLYESPDDSMFMLRVSTEWPDVAEYRPTGEFAVDFDQVLIEDVSGFAVGSEPELAWTNTPVSYRGQESDREDPEDYWKAFYKMPFNIIWRTGEDFTWGLINEDREDLFTSRNYTTVLPGSEWKLRPEWFYVDLGASRKVNQVLYYALYNKGIRSLLVTHGSDLYPTHTAVPVMDGLTLYSSTAKLDVEMREQITARHLQVVILDTDAEGNTATCQELELYNFEDESARILQPVGAAPQVSITMTRSQEITALPDAVTAMVGMANQDGRYTPRNKFSPIYNERMADGLGDIRAGVPIKVSMIATKRTRSLAGTRRYAMQDECDGYGYWHNQYTGLPDPQPGVVYMTPPSSPPIPFMVSSDALTLDVSSYRHIRMKIAELHDNGGSSPFKFRLGVTVGGSGDYSDPGERFYIDGGELTSSPANVKEFVGDIATITGLAGIQTIRAFIEFTEITWNPYTFWIGLDSCYIYAEEGETTKEYETLMFLGTLGVDKNAGGSLGISVDNASKTASLDAVDFTQPLDQPTPLSELNVWENIAAEDALRRLCYLAGIPRQDLAFDETGQTFPVCVLRDQTLRENLNQIVQVLGGRFFSLPDGRLKYQNVAVYRTWTQTEKADFDAGTKTNIDTKTTPGEAFVNNIDWDSRDECNVYPENELDPWETEDSDSFRYLSGGEYVVIAPAGQKSRMTHTKRRAYNKTKGFTLEWDLDLVDNGNGGKFSIWGYTDDVVDFYTPACAWRIEMWMYPNTPTVHFSIGGKRGTYANVEPDTWANYNPYRSRIRIRLTCKGTQYTVYLNDSAIGTYNLVEPRLIRWPFYESASHIVDDFTSAGAFNGSSGNTNTTRDTWHDPNGRYWRDVAGYLRPGTVSSHNPLDDGTTYINFDCMETGIKFDLYLDRGNARRGGWRVKYIDANNNLYFKVQATPDGSHPNKIVLAITLVKRVAGVETVIAEAPTQTNIFEGSQQFWLFTTPGSFRAYIVAYNPEYPPRHDATLVLNLYLSDSNVPASLRSAMKLGPWTPAASDGQVSWDNLEIKAGATPNTHYGDPIEWDEGPAHHWSNQWVIEFGQGNYYDPVEDDYVGKTVIGPIPPEVALQEKPADYAAWGGIGGNFMPAFRLGYVRSKLNGDYVPVVTGELMSRIHDCTAGVTAWGVFEAEVADLPPTQPYNLTPFSNINFYVQVSSDGTTWDPWVSVKPGELIPATVALKRYIRWKASFFKYDSWAFYWKAKLRSVTINWMLTSAGGESSFRLTWNLAAASSASIEGMEIQGASYSLGNPTGNRVVALVNRWVEQAITDMAVEALWSSQELPTVLDNNDVYTINAEYSYPTKKGTGGTLRHAHVSVNGTPYTINDGAVEQVCGNTKISFSSGQGIGVITIKATANSTTVNSAAIDAVAYKPADELYGTERVVAEDDQAQRLTGRVIEAEELDNAFAMTKEIAELYAEAMLVKAKQYRETVNGITIPVRPSLTLEQFGILHAPAIGMHERQIAVTEITHEGFTTTIAGESVRTNEATEYFAPLTLTPTGAYATHRLEGCASSYILRMRDSLTWEEIDVYDFQQDTEYYQTSAGGDWINGTGRSFTVKTLYDQTGNSRHFSTQVTAARQPVLVFNAVNGFPALAFDGVDDYFQAVGFTTDNFINAAAGHIAVHARPEGDPVAQVEAWPLPGIVSDAGDDWNWVGISFGNKDGGGDKVHAWNFDVSYNERDAQAAINRDTWYALEWVLGSAKQKLYLDGIQADSVDTGNVGYMTGEMRIGAGGSGKFKGRLSMLLFFDAVQTPANQEKLVGYLQGH